MSVCYISNMNATKSKQLKVSDRVTWEGNASDQGTVIETGYAAVKIKWDNGQVGIVDHRDMGKVEKP